MTSLHGMEHPGGRAVLDIAVNRDATVLFHTVHSLSREVVVARREPLV